MEGARKNKPFSHTAVPGGGPATYYWPHHIRWTLSIYLSIYLSKALVHLIQHAKLTRLAPSMRGAVLRGVKLTRLAPSRQAGTPHNGSLTAP